MNELTRLLTESQAVFVATVGADGKPHLRPFALMREEEGRYYFCTSGSTSAFADLNGNPYVELCCLSADFVWARISAKVKFTDDTAVRQRALDAKEQLRGLFGTAENPDFKVFYLTEAEAVVRDYSGKPPRTFLIP